MGINLDEFGKKCHTKLDSGIDFLKTAKTHLEDFSKETEDTVKMKLNAAKETLEARKQEAVSAKEKMEAYIKTKTAETEAAVTEWKASHDSKKLKKRAERAELYADSCVDLALYYATEAQVAVFEAATARQDADDSKK